MDDVKPGWKTSEFWTHILFGLLIVGLTAAVDAADSMPPTAKILVTSIAAIAIPLLQQQYAKNRKDLKLAAGAPSPASTATLLEPGKPLELLPINSSADAIHAAVGVVVKAIGDAAAARVQTDAQAIDVLKKGG